MEEHFSKLAHVVHEFPNIYLLNRATYELLPGLHIVGCTLWSHIFKMYEPTASKRSNDIRRIRRGGGLLKLDDMNEMHMTDLEWLEKTLADVAARGEKAIVMTHHMPTYALIDEKYDREAETNCLFATQLDRLICEPVVAWFCGHSHTAKRIVKNGVVVRFELIARHPG
jgi:predicted phosphohydrolase